MTDANVEMEAEATEQSEVLKVPVTKGKGFIEVELGKLPDHVYREALLQGLKVLANRGQTKLTKEAFPDPEKLKEAAMAKADETLQAMYEGKIRIVGGAKGDSKVPREVMTEARRIAKAIVKDEMKRRGVKVSYVESKDITKAANALLAEHPEIVQQAKEEIERRETEGSKYKIDITSIPVSEKKVKAAEAKKADKVLSAAKAQRIVQRGRPLNA